MMLKNFVHWGPYIEDQCNILKIILAPDNRQDFGCEDDVCIGLCIEGVISITFRCSISSIGLEAYHSYDLFLIMFLEEKEYPSPPEHPNQVSAVSQIKNATVIGRRIGRNFPHILRTLKILKI